MSKLLICGAAIFTTNKNTTAVFLAKGVETVNMTEGSHNIVKFTVIQSSCQKHSYS